MTMFFSLVLLLSWLYSGYSVWFLEHATFHAHQVSTKYSKILEKIWVVKQDDQSRFSRKIVFQTVLVISFILHLSFLELLLVRWTRRVHLVFWAFAPFIDKIIIGIENALMLVVSSTLNPGFDKISFNYANLFLRQWCIFPFSFWCSCNWTFSCYFFATSIILWIIISKLSLCRSKHQSARNHDKITMITWLNTKAHINLSI